MDIKIIVATHKPYRMPEDSMYLPVHVGATGKGTIGYTPDNTGDNISEKNANYCELTGLFWLWKNAMTDVVGLAHYRRYFVTRRTKDRWSGIASKKDIERLLKSTDIILPNKRNYVIETNYEQYIHAHHKEDIRQTRKIIIERYPEYIGAFDEVMNRRSGHRFNMFIMKRRYAEEYCEWLFDILFELEKRLDISAYSQNDSRVFGFVAERLLDVWIEANQYSYKELPVASMERENWLKKGFRFVMRKFFPKNKR